MKINYFKSILTFLFFTIAFSQLIFSQDVDIVNYLKKIESGQTAQVKEELIDLKKEYPASPSVLFLEGVLTENGQEAVVKYQYIVDNYPNSKYADAALYRIYSYYYALGLYETAQDKLNKLKNDYPASPYVNIAKQNKLPGEGGLVEDELNEVQEQKNTDVKDSEYKFTIQAGAFTNLANAQSLKSDFDKAGIYSEVRDKNVGGTIFHVVYAGKFINQDDAENFLQIINSRFNLEGRVTEITWNTDK